MKPLSRRSVMAGSAAAVTAIPTLGLSKDATEGGDAELRKLWAEYVRLEGEEDKALETFNRAEEAACEDRPAYDWRYHGIKFRGPQRPLAVFVCDRTIETKTFVLKARTVHTQEAEAAEIRGRLSHEWRQGVTRAEKKHRVEALNKAANRISRSMNDILIEIGETPAATMKGVAVKFAALNAEVDFMQEPASEFVARTYRDMAPLLEVRSPRSDRRA